MTQNPSTSEQRDVIEILTHDHREVEQMFAELIDLSARTDDPSTQRRKDVADQVTIELVRHSVAEEAEVYPLFAKRISKDEATEMEEEHSKAERTMKALEKLSPHEPDFERQLEHLMHEVRAHIEEEERSAFPKMREVFSPDELLEHGAKVERVKGVAPTRPHPSAPDTPPADKILGPVTGLFDRLRDAVSGRGTSD